MIHGKHFTSSHKQLELLVTSWNIQGIKPSILLIYTTHSFQGVRLRLFITASINILNICSLLHYKDVKCNNFMSQFGFLLCSSTFRAASCDPWLQEEASMFWLLVTSTSNSFIWLVLVVKILNVGSFLSSLIPSHRYHFVRWHVL